jgi:uracil-DNA glycosylase
MSAQWLAQRLVNVQAIAGEVREANREAVDATVRATGMKHPSNFQRNTHATSRATAMQHP